MSRWTHVAATFRIDSFGAIPDEELTEVFGNEVTYEDLYSLDDTELPAKTLPMGSEGSLSINIWHNPNEHFMASTLVNVFGDLRDFGCDEDTASLAKWFNECCDALCIRQAIMMVKDDYEEEPHIFCVY